MGAKNNFCLIFYNWSFVYCPHEKLTVYMAVREPLNVSVLIFTQRMILLCTYTYLCSCACVCICTYICMHVEARG